jgi:hypothetical protein
MGKAISDGRIRKYEKFASRKQKGRGEAGKELFGDF